jgi:hypothetical protein
LPIFAISSRLANAPNRAMTIFVTARWAECRKPFAAMMEAAISAAVRGRVAFHSATDKPDQLVRREIPGLVLRRGDMVGMVWRQDRHGRVKAGQRAPELGQLLLGIVYLASDLGSLGPEDG